MSKELTPLQALGKLIEVISPYVLPLGDTQLILDLSDIIETALKRLEKIDNTTTKMNDKELIMFDEEVGKRLKALEIIKDKVAPLVNLDTIDIGDGSNKLKYRVYDNELYAYRPLTEEEYELLKEVLKWP